MTTPTSTSSTRSRKPWTFWAGWLLTIPPVALLLFSASMKLSGSPEAAKGFEHLGWSMDKALTLAVLEITSTLLFLIPQTAVLGAVLLTGYMGGAIATHLRLGEPVIIQTAIGVVVWLALFVREPRLRALLPFRRP